jgi:mannose/cellobiose epimerase-like protein (N-acyl-D-glucosamine 2-epimerase family)
MTTTPALTETEKKDLAAIRARMTDWLKGPAFDLWFEADRDIECGGYYETLSLSGAPVFDNKRVRVSARQVYCYAQAPRLGWAGDWREAVDHGWRFLLTTGLRPDHTLRHIVTRDGHVVNDGPDLYDQAFMLLALAETFRSTGDETYRDFARGALDWLRANFGHPDGGFYDALTQRDILRSNPHMHMFECALAWISVDPDGPWFALAEELSGLCRKRFVRASDGALLETFDAHWNPVEDDSAVIEPGHQFEWAWLLIKWEEAGGADCSDIYRRFYDIGDTYGICPTRRVAIDALKMSLEWAGPQARLWPQTERLKSSLALASRTSGEERARYVANATEAAAALWGYFEGLRPGLWRDKMKGDGTFVEEPAPASTFYHIVCAISELQAFKI